MADLRKRFGSLVAAHRHRRGLTQQELAEAASLSVDMISKIESGSTGARFRAIQSLADALEVDPAELFSTEIPSGAFSRTSFQSVCSRLVGLSEHDLLWVQDLLEIVLRPRNAVSVPIPDVKNRSGSRIATDTARNRGIKGPRRRSTRHQ